MRLVPAALSAWGGMWIATSAQAPWLSLGVVSALACAAWGWRRRSWTLAAVAVVLLGCMVIGWARWWWRVNDPLIQLAEAQAVATAEVTVLERLTAARVPGRARPGGSVWRGWNCWRPAANASSAGQRCR